MATPRWDAFFAATKDHPHWPLLEQAAAQVGRLGAALDLGCGAGRDTRYLLAQGWSVTAVDREAAAVALVGALGSPRLRVVQSSFDDFDYGEARYDLVSAQFALPFCSPARFGSVFERIKRALAPGGVFAGQLFGVRDEWNTPGADMTFLAREQVEALLADMRVHRMDEDERVGPTALGAPKHWHVFHIIAELL